MIKPELLQQQVLLQDIDSAGLDKIAKIVKQVTVKKGEPLFKEKDPARLPWKAEGKGFAVTIPDDVRANPPCQHAWAIKVSRVR